jgi:MATE family multidrug resistance protein
MALGVAFQAAMAICVIVWRVQIPFLVFGSAGDPATVALTSTLLVVGASFFIADGLQVIAAGALRGFNDTRVPFLFAAASFWLVGFPCAYLLAFRAGLGAVGVWVGLVLGLVCYAALLVTRFTRLAHPEYLPSTTPTVAATAHA